MSSSTTRMNRLWTNWSKPSKVASLRESTMPSRRMDQSKLRHKSRPESEATSSSLPSSLPPRIFPKEWKLLEVSCPFSFYLFLSRSLSWYFPALANVFSLCRHYRNSAFASRDRGLSKVRHRSSRERIAPNETRPSRRWQRSWVDRSWSRCSEEGCLVQESRR